jgi:heme iron utilization protein
MSTGKHAGPGPTAAHAEIAEPSFAERVRTMVDQGRIGSLSTISRRQAGYPFGSVMPYGVDAHGRPIFLISTMAMHTQNILGDPRASLLVTQAGADDDPLGAARATLMGNVGLVPKPELAEARKVYLERYENSKHWVDFEDFGFYRIELIDVYYVGGFGVMGWVAATEYEQAQPDPLADSASRIIQHMNADHREAMVLLAKEFAGVEAEDATMTAVDRLGFQARLKTAEGLRGVRIAFLRNVSSAAEARTVLVEMTQRAQRA